MSETPLDYAKSKIGDPYVWGATGPNSFDCSGLTQWAYGQAGLKIPRTSQEQRSAGSVISLAEAQPGDLITFTYPGESGNPGPGNHVGLYVSPGVLLDAPTQGQNVQEQPIDTAHLDRVVHITGNETPGTGVATGAADGSVTDAGFSLLDPFGIFGDLTGTVSTAGEAIAESILKAVGPLLLSGISLAAAAALVVLGMWRMTEPARQKAEQTAKTAAKTAAEVGAVAA